MQQQRFKHCIQCKEDFTNNNVYSKDGWKETQISDLCESCFNKNFETEIDRED